MKLPPTLITRQSESGTIAVSRFTPNTSLPVSSVRVSVNPVGVAVPDRSYLPAATGDSPPIDVAPRTGGLASGVPAGASAGSSLPASKPSRPHALHAQPT